MRIAWDARVLCQPERRGMGTYAANLLTAIRRLRPDVELLLFHDSDRASASRIGAPARRIGPNRGYRWQLWEQLGLPLHAYLSKSDVLHSVANTTPPRALTPRVVTVHDVIPYLPEFGGDAPALPYFRNTVPAAVKRADAVITDSECSRDDIARVFGVSRERIAVVPLAVDPAFMPPEERERAAILGALGVRQPYVLAHAASLYRKNTLGTLRAFRHVIGHEPDLQLVFTGVSPALALWLRRAMDTIHLPHARVIFTGFVDRTALAALYAQAEAFLFLSLYEGFGLPILEALNCGAPVVCSNRSSCPEVAGDAAVLVDPEAHADVAQAILAVKGRSTKERLAWRGRGAAQVARFDWTSTAESTLRVYDAVAGS